MEKLSAVAVDWPLICVALVKVSTQGTNPIRQQIGNYWKFWYQLGLWFHTIDSQCDTGSAGSGSPGFEKFRLFPAVTQLLYELDQIDGLEGFFK